MEFSDEKRRAHYEVVNQRRWMAAHGWTREGYQTHYADFQSVNAGDVDALYYADVESLVDYQRRFDAA